MKTRKVVLFISMSVDGFIATNDDDLSWLSMVEKAGEDYGYQSILNRTDTYIVGRKTYDVIKALMGGKFPQSDIFDCYVVTQKAIENEKGITFYNGDIEKLINELKDKPGKDIYCDGGGQIVQLFMEKNLIDEYIISVIPTILGSGKRLFLGGVEGIRLKAKPSRYFESGLVQLHYEKA